MAPITIQIERNFSDSESESEYDYVNNDDGDDDGDGGSDGESDNYRDEEGPPTPERMPSGIYFDELADDEYGIVGRKSSRHGRHVTQFPKFKNGDRTDRAKTRCLPLLDVAVKVAVTGTLSRTSLTQSFTNFTDAMLKETIYAFPLYDGAAVMSFRCMVGDDRIIDGRIKTRAEAKARYEQARAEGRVAALLEEHTPEVFEMRIGNIAPKTVVKVIIEYVNELKAEPGDGGLLRHDLGGEGIRVTVPTSVAPRYGAQPSGMSTFTTSTAKNRLEITVDVTSPVPLVGLESDTHPISVVWDAVESTPVASIFDLVEPAEAADTARRHAKATLSNRTATLGSDFSLLIRASGPTLLASRAMIEPSNDLSTPHALMVSLQPRTLFPAESYAQTFRGEVIMVADCSGSMRGAKIEALRDSLVVFVQSLPPRSRFNIYSFGTEFRSVFSGSKWNSQNKVKDALRFIASLKPNMGGTDTVRVFEDVLRSRMRIEDHSTQVILLSDGGMWGTEEVIKFVRAARRKYLDTVRFFTLGVGDVVSHRLIEGVAKEGGGFGEVIAEGHGNWGERVLRLLNGALMPDTWSIKIELDGVPTDKLLSKNTRDHEPDFVQAPCKVPPLHSFARQSIYFMINPDEEFKTITVIATAPDSRRAIATLELERSIAPADTIHYLAAKAAMRDLEHGQSWIHQNHGNEKLSASAVDRLARQEGERLGLQYHITGKWTSFVAVEENDLSTDQDRGFELPSSGLADLLSSRYTGALGGMGRLGDYLTKARLPSTDTIKRLPAAYMGSTDDEKDALPQANPARASPAEGLDSSSSDAPSSGRLYGGFANRRSHRRSIGYHRNSRNSDSSRASSRDNTQQDSRRNRHDSISEPNDMPGEQSQYRSERRKRNRRRGTQPDDRRIPIYGVEYEVKAKRPSTRRQEKQDPYDEDNYRPSGRYAENTLPQDTRRDYRRSVNRPRAPTRPMSYHQQASLEYTGYPDPYSTLPSGGGGGGGGGYSRSEEGHHAHWPSPMDEHYDPYTYEFGGHQRINTFQPVYPRLAAPSAPINIYNGDSNESVGNDHPDERRRRAESHSHGSFSSLNAPNMRETADTNRPGYGTRRYSSTASNTRESRPPPRISTSESSGPSKRGTLYMSDTAEIKQREKREQQSAYNVEMREDARRPRRRRSSLQDHEPEVRVQPREREDRLRDKERHAAHKSDELLAVGHRDEYERRLLESQARQKRQTELQESERRLREKQKLEQMDREEILWRTKYELKQTRDKLAKEEAEDVQLWKEGRREREKSQDDGLQRHHQQQEEDKKARRRQEIQEKRDRLRRLREGRQTRELRSMRQASYGSEHASRLPKYEIDSMVAAIATTRTDSEAESSTGSWEHVYGGISRPKQRGEAKIEDVKEAIEKKTTEKEATEERLRDEMQSRLAKLELTERDRIRAEANARRQQEQAGEEYLAKLEMNRFAERDKLREQANTRREEEDRERQRLEREEEERKRNQRLQGNRVAAILDLKGIGAKGEGGSDPASVTMTPTIALEELLRVQQSTGEFLLTKRLQREVFKHLRPGLSEDLARYLRVNINLLKRGSDAQSIADTIACTAFIRDFYVHSSALAKTVIEEARSWLQLQFNDATDITKLEDMVLFYPERQ